MLSPESNDPQRTSSDRSAVADLSAEEKQLFDQIGDDAARREPMLDLKCFGGCFLPITW